MSDYPKDTKVFIGKTYPPHERCKNFVIAEVIFREDDLFKLKDWLDANNGTVGIKLAKGRNDSTYCEINTFRRNIPPNFVPEEYNKPQQQQSSHSQAPQQREYPKEDRPQENPHQREVKEQEDTSRQDYDSTNTDDSIPF